MVNAYAPIEEEEHVTETDFSLSPPQWDFYESNERFLVFVAGRNGGKTTAACMRMIHLIEDGTIRDGARIVVFGPTYPQLKFGTLKTFDKWFDAAGLTLEKINGNEPERRLIRGITVYFRNASNPDQTRSHEVQMVWLDEAGQMAENVLTLTNAALRQFGDNAPYQTLITTTPRGRNWIHRWFFDPATLRYAPHMVKTFHTTTLQAYEHGVVREGYIEELGYLPGSDMWKQEVEAEFLSWSGLVFDKYNRQKHSPDPFTHAPFTRVYGGVDVGYGSYTAMHLTGQTPNGALYTFAEYYVKRATPHEWMKVAGEWTKQHNVQRWYVDSAADQELRAMKSAGLRAYPSMKAKDAAGTAVGYINGKFMKDEMFIDAANCPYLVSELETYQYKELLAGDEVTFLDKVKPNQQDHAIDAWRYHVLPLSGSGAAQTYGRVLEFSMGGR